MPIGRTKYIRKNETNSLCAIMCLASLKMWMIDIVFWYAKSYDTHQMCARYTYGIGLYSIDMDYNSIRHFIETFFLRDHIYFVPLPHRIFYSLSLDFYRFIVVFATIHLFAISSWWIYAILLMAMDGRDWLSCLRYTLKWNGVMRKIENGFYVTSCERILNFTFIGNTIEKRTIHTHTHNF